MSFKINYLGCKMLLDFEYKCMDCGHIHVIEQYRCDDMQNRTCLCKGCKGHLSRYMRTAPCLDADYHDSLRTYNIGWDS